jgi:hypothetical protein
MTKLMLVNVERRRLLPDQRALFEPLAKSLGRLLVVVAVPLGQLEADGVVGAEAVETTLLLLGDRIERGANDAGEVDIRSKLDSL